MVEENKMIPGYALLQDSIVNTLARFKRNASLPNLSPGQRAAYQELFDFNKDKYPFLRARIAALP